MQKFHVKKGDEVVVISGNGKGRRGEVVEVLRKKDSVILEAKDEQSKSTEDHIRLIRPTTHYLRKSQQNPEGGIVVIEGPIHISNVMLAANYESRRAKHAQA